MDTESVNVRHKDEDSREKDDDSKNENQQSENEVDEESMNEEIEADEIEENSAENTEPLKKMARIMDTKKIHGQDDFDENRNVDGSVSYSRINQKIEGPLPNLEKFDCEYHPDWDPEAFEGAKGPYVFDNKVAGAEVPYMYEEQVPENSRRIYVHMARLLIYYGKALKRAELEKEELEDKYKEILKRSKRYLLTKDQCRSVTRATKALIWPRLKFYDRETLDTQDKIVNIMKQELGLDDHKAEDLRHSLLQQTNKAMTEYRQNVLKNIKSAYMSE